MSMKPVCTHIAGALVAVSLAFGAVGALAQSANPAAFPEKSVRIIVPFTPGGGNDVLARIIAGKISERWKHPMLVENRPGAGGNIGTELVAKAPPDGYTILMGANQLAMIPYLYAKLPFDVQKDLKPITQLANTPLMFAVHNGLPIQTVKELIAYGKANPGKLAFATPGNGTPQHLGAEMFMSMAGVQMLHVPYKGAVATWAALMTGEVGVHFGALNSAFGLARAGKIRLLGTGSSKRLSMLPDVPTVAEAGVPGYEADIWYGLFTSGGTPDDIVARLREEVVKVLESPDVKNLLNGQGFEVTTSTPQALGNTLRADLERWGKVIRTAGITAQQ